MKVTIEIELDECYEEQVFENTTFDQKMSGDGDYETSFTEHALRAVIEQADGTGSFYKYNSDKEDKRIPKEINFLQMCEQGKVKVKVSVHSLIGT